MAHTYQIISQSTGQCLSKCRQGIRQSSCSGPTAWTVQRIGSTGHRYRVLVPSTVGTGSPACVQVYPTPQGYPGPIFSIVACSSDPSQILKITASL